MDEKFAHTEDRVHEFGKELRLLMDKYFIHKEMSVDLYALKDPKEEQYVLMINPIEFKLK